MNRSTPLSRLTLDAVAESVEPHYHVQKAMKRLGALGQLCQIPLLQRRSERVEQ